MARLMMTVGDLQVSIQPVPGSLTSLVRDVKMPAGHPLAAGDHEVAFYDIVKNGRDNFCSRIMSESEAMAVVGLWLLVDGEQDDTKARQVFSNLFGEDVCKWLMP